MESNKQSYSIIRPITVVCVCVKSVTEEEASRYLGGQQGEEGIPESTESVSKVREARNNNPTSPRLLCESINSEGLEIAGS